ncbi:MAG: peptide chain release factor 3 [Alphaproteobacteria bacterium]|nr:MAG: peptide chain release factor 3 [Alphaproteobacteria bacterium]
MTAQPQTSATLAATAAKRRTFAIISHPDAGKTTLTENLLLMGGAIHLAGEVKARGEARRARSDWMKIEQQRGISVTTAVMTFEYRDVTFNLLDTPGHEDFSEDTYRTLTAADSAIMVIDAAKGIEPQTLKLFEVCRLRDIPIITLVNKVDREGRETFEILEEISETLALDTVPMTWPAGMGGLLKGIFNFRDKKFITYDREQGVGEILADMDAETLASVMEADAAENACLEASLAQEGYPEFDLEAYRGGHMTPVYFGSALRKFGIKEVLDAVLDFAPPPQPQMTTERIVEPGEDKVSGFVFKVQANMDPNHRDRIAFMRLCSGKFKRGMKLKPAGSTKAIGIHNPILFFAQSRELAEEAWPGDIIGVPNHGTLRVGDSLSENGDLKFTGIPNFAPEILRRVRLGDPMKAKHMRRALESLAEEGVTQVFKPTIGSNWIVGVVGALQLDVLVNRIEAEYGLAIDFEPAPFETARWISTEDPKELARFEESNRLALSEDRDGNPVFLAKSNWEVGYMEEKFPAITFSKTCERR